MNSIFLSLLLQAWFALLAIAAPIVDESLSTADHGNAWQYGTGGGILGLIVLILDVMVFVEVFKSSRPPASKLIWCLVVFLFPFVGMVIYWLFSNRSAHNNGAGYEALT